MKHTHCVFILALAVALLPSVARTQTNAGWSVYGGDAQNTRYSSLNQLSTDNVHQLRVAWVLQLGTLRSQESTPLVIGDTLYVTSSFGPKYLFAVDAKTGAERWRYAPEIPAGIEQFACCDVNSRGVAYAK
jgi:glucose dehydrogenase